jgi:hypothetical protein
VTAVGHKFSLVLSREITDDESALLQEAGCTSAVFGKDTLPTNASIPVTKMDFDDLESPSLAEAIESALEAVKKVPDLGVPGLTVPAVVPAGAEETAPGVVVGEVLEETVLEGTVLTQAVLEEAPAPKKTTARKPAKKAGGSGRTSVKKIPAAAAPSDDVPVDIPVETLSSAPIR